MFDLSNITLAFATRSAADDQFALMQADMICWHMSATYPTNAELITAIIAGLPIGRATAKVYASRILKWARSGQTPSSISAAIATDPKGSVKGKGGRPAGKGAGKTTKAAAAKAAAAKAEAPAVPNDDAAWRQFIGDMRSKVAGRKDWPAENIAAFQDAAAKLLALLKAAAK